MMFYAIGMTVHVKTERVRGPGKIVEILHGVVVSNANKRAVKYRVVWPDGSEVLVGQKDMNKYANQSERKDAMFERQARMWSKPKEQK